MIRVGIHADTVEQLSDELKLPVSQLLSLLNICRRTVNRRKADGKKLPPEISEKILRTKRVYLKTLDVMKEEDCARDWLNSKNFSLGDETPLSLLDTSVGGNMVLNLLGAIEESIPL